MTRYESRAASRFTSERLQQRQRLADANVSEPSIGFVGAGKVGTALARTWARAGFRIKAVCSRKGFSSASIAEELGALAVVSPTDVLSQSDLTVLAVPDDAISSVVQSFSTSEWHGKAVIHTSGVHSSEVLAVLAERGAMTGSLHPAYPFSGRDIGSVIPSGVTFAIESDHQQLAEWLSTLVEAAEGVSITLRPESKTLYHAALTLTSNYTVSLFAASKKILTGLGANDASAEAVLVRLLQGTIENLSLQGTPRALTGPLLRGDVGTVDAHLTALSGWPEILAVYVALARLTLPLIAEQGLATDGIRQVLMNWEGK